MYTKAFTLATLLTLTSALPSGSGKTIVDRQGATIRTDCWNIKPGTQFYRCANGYIGCFEKDPCALPPLAADPTQPTESTPSTSPAPPASTANEITEPRSYNIYEQFPDSYDPVPHVDLKKTVEGGIVTRNAMVFENVPEGATNCNLMWRSDKADDKNSFFVTGEGQVWSRQLTGFPAEDEDVTYATLEEFRNNDVEFSQSMDMTGWPASPSDHMGPSLECGSVVAVELHGSDKGDGENRVFITNTATNGFYLSYDL